MHVWSHTGYFSKLKTLPSYPILVRLGILADWMLEGVLLPPTVLTKVLVSNKYWKQTADNPMNTRNAALKWHLCPRYQCVVIVYCIALWLHTLVVFLTYNTTNYWTFWPSVSIGERWVKCLFTPMKKDPQIQSDAVFQQSRTLNAAFCVLTDPQISYSIEYLWQCHTWTWLGAQNISSRSSGRGGF